MLWSFCRKKLTEMRWENFDKSITRAMDSCETGGIEVTDHFREVKKMISVRAGADRLRTIC